ncbi:uncharacterized protein LOC129918588 [Episyrphus balteatus]|uniref:uncharacterized protein LOC129918588 n=1 Tax=Episyrphus balteatus TaxID=286459 RepID=UPI00248676EA|nr:uncharacterized protein LOC129918588 [Episyrphus balteatus]XP_055855182.1 uncharacterized protein LOC129918588 [Episyrphus balteatus]
MKYCTKNHIVYSVEVFKSEVKIFAMNYYEIKIITALIAIIAAEFSPTNANFNSKFLSFIENLHKIEQFETIFLLKSSKEPFFNENFIKNVTNTIGIPIILSTANSSYYLKEKFNENLFPILQFDSNVEYLRQLLEYLQHLRSSKMIFVIKNSSRNYLDLKNVFDFCWMNRIINVIAVFQDFETSSVYYSYSNFGDFRIEEFIWNKKKIQDVFPNRMKDLNGITLPILFGGPQPGVIISKNANGGTKIGGYAGNIFNTFAKRHNARLNTSYVNTSLSARDIFALVKYGKVEMSGVFPFGLSHPISFCSYPVINFDWCIMVPIEPKIPIYKVFVYVFEWKPFLLTIVVLILLSILVSKAAKFTGTYQNFKIYDYFFNIDFFRGILGQSFSETPNASGTTKIIYLLIFLLGIMIVTSYNAFLQSFMTELPRENIIKSYEELKSFNLKIYIYEMDFNVLLYLRPELKQFKNSFKIEPSFEIFENFQDNLNTRYAYQVNSHKWQIYKNQQKFFGQQLFRWSDELCIWKNALAAFPLNENSIYKNALNFHILELQSAGLMDFWKKRSFYELMAIGRIQKLNFTNEVNLEPLKVEDLKRIWIMMGLAYMVGTLVFIGENCLFILKNK